MPRNRPVPGLLEQRDRPTSGDLETRAAPTVVVDGRRLRGMIPYNVESRDLGGFRERMAPGCLRNADLSDLVATVDHAGVPLGRHPTTLSVEDLDDGLHWSVELPESRADVREAVERGDLRSASWRMIVARDRWEGDLRIVEEVRSLRDVSVVTTAAYRAPVELRNAPGRSDPRPLPAYPTATPPARSGGLRPEDRTADQQSTIESRVLDAIRSINKGEARSLNTTTAAPIAPEEQGTFLWDRLRPVSIGLASGITVIPTSRQSITWPRVLSDVDPTWVAESTLIPAGDPTFGELSADPKKLAHRVEMSNEVVDDSEPSVVDVLNNHLALMLALKLDRGIFEGNPATDPISIRGLKYVSGTQSIDLGANGAALANYDPFIRAVGMLRDANVPGPYAIAMSGRTLTGLELLKEATGSNLQLAAPASMPPVYTTSQLSIAEAKGTATNSSSAYVYAPAQIVLVRRMDAEIEMDRSRLFDFDMSEMRAKTRADLIVPNPVAVVRITGILPAP